MIPYEIKSEFEENLRKFTELSTLFDLTAARKRAIQLEEEMSTPDFWSDTVKASHILKEVKLLKAQITEYQSLKSLIEDAEAALELSSEDESMESQAIELFHKLRRAVKEYELSMLLDDDFDANNAFLTIHPGAGGTESQDWAQMLMRMYLRWAERKGYTSQILELQPGEEAGIKDVTLFITGAYVYGNIKWEQGVHRLVRLSPFNANNLRQTSFASVSILPELDDTITVDIDPEDLRVDLYRASGAGGQHVNRTESAVRITHLPTGIVVACQNERNQHQNKATAMKILAARLYRVEEEKHKKEVNSIQGELTRISWGNQIRSYVFQPYKMVKDHRTETETGNVDAVMDGDLDAFIEAELIFFSKKNQKAPK
jgi:peptide chain release factor 2